MELHTTLTALKAALHGQATPMTALTAEARALFDPAFTNGMGSLIEDAALGLRCPVRGCGRWYDNLSRHIQQTHHDAGGVVAFRVALGIPRTAPLLSTRLRIARRAAASRVAPVARVQPSADSAQRAGATKRETWHTPGARNLKDRCDAQLRQKLLELQRVIGRTPTFKEAVVAWGAGLVSYIVRTYETWNHFKDQCGVPTLKRGGQPTITLDDVVTLLKAWAAEHGDLPTYDQTAADRTLPNPATILRVLCTAQWDAAMQRVALILNIAGGRYGRGSVLSNLLRRCFSCEQLTRVDPCKHCGRASDVAA